MNQNQNQMIAPGKEAGPKVVRLLCFVGAGFLCTAAINKWREWERKSTIQKQQQEEEGQLLEKPSNAVQRALE